jgi:hypothetical protein
VFRQILQKNSADGSLFSPLQKRRKIGKTFLLMLLMMTTVMMMIMMMLLNVGPCTTRPTTNDNETRKKK